VSPLQASKYSEFQDISFLEAIGAKHLVPELKKFWPYRGPCWDALARLEGGGCVQVITSALLKEFPEQTSKTARSAGDVRMASSTGKQALDVRPPEDGEG
jgi:hypothetical protein